MVLAPADLVEAELMSVGRMAPATAWPDEINATADPRRRSNQRLT